MPHRYLAELVTPAVRKAQHTYGSSTNIQRIIDSGDTDAHLGDTEAEFIAARDGFYLATVGETGWPYVQYRGGPPGFLHLLDPTPQGSVLAWADLRGNRQYVSVGNLDASPRVALFLMDYPRKRRLKILGEAHVLDARDGATRAEWAARLAPPDDKAHVERVITVAVRGYDWNCPQHITPRWTAAELAPLTDELTALREENQRLRHLAGIGPGDPE